MTCAIIKQSGTVPEENEWLYKIIAIIEFRLLSKELEMLNGPEAFLDLRFEFPART